MRPDPITLGVVWGALQSICVEIGSTVQRTAYSIQAREGQDFSVALFDAAGRMSAQGPYSPGHMGAMNFAIRNFLAAFPAETLRPGDTLLLNDPQLGSGHFPDFLVTQPCFWRGELVGFGVNLVHHTDVGGARPGSQAVEGIFDWHQEGLRIPPVKIVEEGRENAAALAIIGANSRVPRNVLGDLRSQRASLRVGEQRIGELFGRFGRETVDACVETMLGETEARVRERIAAMPDGAYPFQDFMDDWGTGTEPLRIAVTVTIAGDRIVVDFAGTDAQTPSGLNSYFNYTRSYVYAAVKCLTDPYGPMNAGALRPVEIVAPEGCFLNPRPPAGGGPRAAICTRIFEVVLGALAPALPAAVTAANSHFCNATFGAWDPVRRRRFVGYELIHGGTGARAGRDGCEAMSSPYNAANIPIEAVEAATPVLVERFELLPDSGGRGRFRGGLGVRRDVRILGEDIRFTNLSERHRFRPFGVAGGEPGRLGRTVVNPGAPGEREIGGKASVDLAYGDVVSFQLAGAGGYGDPGERDPALIAEDVRLGLVTRW
ncbi:MAG TPA: hydantoinase B/oxoprolinase family protein [Candidatus Dormibacteraeota bacterium]|nr:hydantoinase B/oxoprolinase family protein [Candidatus Dormibacteraeota bacterium]